MRQPQLGAFFTAYAVTVGIVLLSTFVRWTREQRRGLSKGALYRGLG